MAMGGITKPHAALIEGLSLFGNVDASPTPAFPSAAACSLDFGDVDFTHLHHRMEGAFGFSATGGYRVRQHVRRDLPGDSPPILAPAASALLAAIADDRIPIAIRFLLSIGCNLKGKRLGVCKLRPTIQTQTRNAKNCEFHREDFVFLAAGIIARGFVNRYYFTVGERGSVEARRILRILVKPKADGVLCFRVAHKTSCREQ
jgi:hypothetical protein